MYSACSSRASTALQRELNVAVKLNTDCFQRFIRKFRGGDGSSYGGEQRRAWPRWWQVRARGRRRQRRRWQTTHDLDNKFGRNLIHRSISLGNILVRPQERAHVHDDPERRALAQPRNDIATTAPVPPGTSRECARRIARRCTRMRTHARRQKEGT